MNQDQIAMATIEHQKKAQIEAALEIARAAAHEVTQHPLATPPAATPTSTAQKAEHLAAMFTTPAEQQARANQALVTCDAVRRGFPATTFAQNTAVDPITGHPTTH
ncbi:hypothetical protein M2317_001316 [Microbacterium sp. ZKA21]|uniref:hypothetical protein n=1 Tax=Microbacterium sp. ZKA21 TaxID=3381694 RepID=UPI003D19A9CA